MTARIPVVMLRKRAKAELKAFRPSRREAWRVCDTTTGNCSCLRTNSGPCEAWRNILMMAHFHNIDPVEYERRRIACGLAGVLFNPAQQSRDP